MEYKARYPVQKEHEGIPDRGPRDRGMLQRGRATGAIAKRASGPAERAARQVLGGKMDQTGGMKVPGLYCGRRGINQKGAGDDHALGPVGLRGGGLRGRRGPCAYEIREMEPDIVITDIRMVRLSGLDLLSAAGRGRRSQFIIIFRLQ